MSSERRLFVYDTMLSGEPDHPLLRGAERLASARTEATFHLVDLGAFGALVPGGSTAVEGEVYSVDRETYLAIDVRREVPVLFQRCAITLEDGTTAEAHVMTPDQVRGRRRVGSGSWRGRFAAPAPAATSRPWTEWVRGRKG
jgi:gamma-glutamylaminecyclotransferase